MQGTKVQSPLAPLEGPECVSRVRSGNSVSLSVFHGSCATYGLMTVSQLAASHREAAWVRTQCKLYNQTSRTRCKAAAALASLVAQNM